MTLFKIGARGSKLSIAQSQTSIQQLESALPHLEFNLIPIETTGDRDLKVQLNDPSVGDNFFTDDIDQKVLSGELSAAIHSAKDLPNYDGTDIDFFYLPWTEDSRDAVLWPRGRDHNNLNPVVGVSSGAREAYAKHRWPKGNLKGIRGAIDSRIEQLDDGDFDVILLAVAGLKRLGLEKRLDEILNEDELPTHEDQGRIAITFRRGDPDWLAIRNTLLHPVVIAGAGTGREGNYSVAVSEALSQADLCLHDSLMAPEVLHHCSGHFHHVGKRFGQGNTKERQKHLIETMVRGARRGERVLRLKGGDPSLFGRLKEELDALSQEGWPFRVLPGIPWICSAPLRHGIFLTEREQTRHFQVATGTEIEGKTFDGRDLDPEKGPVYFFMAIHKIPEIVSGLIKRGYRADTPCAVFREDPDEQSIIRSTLEGIEEAMAQSNLKPPALFLVGEPARADLAFQSPKGSLDGLKILTPGTPKTQKVLSQAILDQGGIPIPLTVFELKAEKEGAKAWLDRLDDFDWLVLSSASAVQCLLELLHHFEIDLRRLPSLAVSGPSAARALKAVGLLADYQPSSYTSRDLGEGMLKQLDIKDQKVLIPRSSASKSPLPNILEDAGARVEVVTLYANRSIEVDSLPEFDAVCFCSPSGFQPLERFKDELKDVIKVSIGPVTTQAMVEAHWEVDVEPTVFNAQHMIWALASHLQWNTHR
jgi:uroporphyrinogen III methyltransferase / synthase